MPDERPLPTPLVAVSLLTRLPVPARPVGEVALARAGAWFGAVGGLVGLLVAAVLLAAGLVLPATVAAVLAVAVELLATGALHLDGLADCSDGISGRDPEQRLRIMRDHAVGVYGAATVILALLLRVACLSALLGSGTSAAGLVGGLVAAYALSRAAMLLPALVLDYPRAQGTGLRVVTGLTRRDALVGGLLGVLLGAAGSGAAARGADGAGAGGMGPASIGAGWIGAVLAVLAAAALGAAVVTRWARSRLGGATGDVLGATAEVALGLVLLVLVASR